jgi:hypothetical protein
MAVHENAFFKRENDCFNFDFYIPTIFSRSAFVRGFSFSPHCNVPILPPP